MVTVSAGIALRPAPVRPALPRPALERPRDCLLSGTAAGLARHLGWPVLIVRAIFVLLVPVAGAGLLLYAWLWAFVPWQAGAEPARRRMPVAILSLIVSAVLVLVVLSAIGRYDRSGVPPWLVPAIVAAGFAVLASSWATFVDRTDPLRGPLAERIARYTAAGLLAVLLVMILTGPRAGMDALFAVVVVLVAIGLVFAPSLVAQWRQLTTERTRLIREEQRSEIAAHLHDSVLQTLALIQNRAGASSEVARLARAQERELRNWLYAGDAPADSDLGTDLRDFAGALELDYAVRVDVVVVGASTERASGELAAAAREAMLNAARHAGGEVSVYIEGSAESVDVFVRDRGPGFDPAEVPSDRLGVRESIIGRMRRAGGSAEVRPGAGGEGTEVHLRFDNAVRFENGARRG